MVLTQWHRDIHAEIGGDGPGAPFDEHLGAVGVDDIWGAEVEGPVGSPVATSTSEEEDPRPSARLRRRPRPGPRAS